LAASPDDFQTSDEGALQRCIRHESLDRQTGTLAE
jgi:hypothetical protein